MISKVKSSNSFHRGRAQSRNNGVAYQLEKHPHIALPIKELLFSMTKSFRGPVTTINCTKLLQFSRTLAEIDPDYLYWDRHGKIWNYRKLELVILLRARRPRLFALNMQRDRATNARFSCREAEEKPGDAAPWQRAFFYIVAVLRRQLERVFRFFRLSCEIVRFDVTSDFATESLVFTLSALPCGTFATRKESNPL